jgi:hypothetical protein
LGRGRVVSVWAVKSCSSRSALIQRPAAPGMCGRQAAAVAAKGRAVTALLVIAFCGITAIVFNTSAPACGPGIRERRRRLAAR